MGFGLKREETGRAPIWEFPERAPTEPESGPQVPQEGGES